MIERRRLLIQGCQILVLGILVAYALAYLALSDPFGRQSMGADFNAYWNAADRLRQGQALYPAAPDQQANDVFRYSAWFAVGLVPATLLPYELVATVWIALAFAMGVYLLRVTAGGLSLANCALLLLVGPWVIENAWVGQAQLFIAAALTSLLHRKAGPLAIGVAASLKATPIAFVGYYLARREWRRALLATGSFLILAAPTLLFDLEHYPTDSSEMALLGAPAWLWPLIAAAVSGAMLALAWRNPRYLVLTLGTIAIVAAPRIHPISITYLLPALARAHRSSGAESRNNNRYALGSLLRGDPR